MASAGRLTSDNPLLFGVANALARRVGADRQLVRVSFALLVLAGGVGIPLYGLAWLLSGRSLEVEGPVESSRANLGIIAATLSVLTFTTAFMWFLPATLLWVVSLFSVGVAFGDTVSFDSEHRFGSGPVRNGVGVGLVLIAVVVLGSSTQDLRQLWQTLILLVMAVAGIGVVLGPWLRELNKTVADERLERMRAEHRADIAAHLHDSVLQTLTLIQNRASEPDVTAALAHRQERELRQWLYENARSGPRHDTLRASLEAVAAEIEDQYLIIVETITVGDVAYDEALDPIVAATREALVNAAKFSETQLVSLFAECEDEMVAIYVRDRGVGFDPAVVSSDRRGIKESIVERVERVGGQATIRSEVGNGTEIKLCLPWGVIDE